MNDAVSIDRLLRERRSIRRFQDRPVPRETLDALVEAAAWAPSAGNRQDWRFAIVTSREAKAQMSQAAGDAWERILRDNSDYAMIADVADYVSRFGDLAAAPVVVVVSAAEPGALQQQLLGAAAVAVSGSFASAAMAAQNLMLAAHARGLGACCMTGPLAASEEIARIAAIGRHRRIVCLIALGWPAESPAAPPRKPIEEIARFIE